MSKERERILEELKKLSREIEENDELISEEHQAIRLHQDTVYALEDGQRYLKAKYDTLVKELLNTTE